VAPDTRDMNCQHQNSPSEPLRAGPGSPTIACGALAFRMHALPPPTRLSDCCKRRRLTLDAQGVDTPGEAWGGWGKPFTLRCSPHRSHHHMVQTSPIESIMHGITKVECRRASPSQGIQGPGKDGELRFAQLHKPRQGQVCLWLFLALASLLLLGMLVQFLL
jgi:hypothetical protein